MARRRQGRYALAALVMSAGVAGCDMSEAGVHSDPQRGWQAALSLANSFLDSDEGVALLKARGATIDSSFAENGSYGFRIAGVAEQGSRLEAAVERDAVAPETLTIVFPRNVRPTLDALAGLVGKRAQPLPGVPGQPWQYRFERSHGRSVLAATTGGAGRTGSVVERIVAIRER